MNLKHFIELSRIEHALMAALAVIIGEFLAFGFAVPLTATLLACISTIAIAIAGFIYSDYHDVETDILNKRHDRPLARGDVHPREALTASIVFFAIGGISAYFINSTVFAIAVIFIMLSVLYAYSLKKVPLVGNILIAMCMNIPFIFGNLVVSRFVSAPVFLIALSSLFFGIGREIIKSIEDMYGDKKTGRVTLPMLTGIKKSEWFASITIFMAIAVHVYLFFKILPFRYQLVYLVPTLVGDFIIAYALHELIIDRKSNYRQIRNLTLIAPLFVMLGVFLVLLF